MKIIQSLWLLLPVLLDFTGDFFLLGEISKSLNVCDHFEAEGVDGLLWFVSGAGRIGIRGMLGRASDSMITRRL